MSLKLHAYPGLGLSRKIHVASNFVGVQIEQVNHDKDQSKSADYLKKNPNGKFPTLETAEGKFIFESNAILRYVARLDKSKGLYGSDILEESLVDQWLDWWSNEGAPNYYGTIGVFFGWPGTKETQKAAEQKLRPVLKILDDHLKINTNLVGNKVTIADINIAGTLFTPFRFLWDEKWRKTIPNVTRWFETLMSQEPFTKEYGRVILCQKPLDFPNIPQEESKKEEKKPATKKEDKPKAAEAKPKKEEKVKDEEDEAPAEKKEKNPLDLLPPSTFNLFDFKTLFVNATDKNEALDFFFKNFDPQGYSIWFIQYQKAEGEGKVTFLTSNLMNGFLQRLDHFRKYAFAVHGVYGDEPSLEIRGVWVWRGTELPAEIKDLDSFEYHTFTKLDPNNEEHKKKVKEYWTALNEDEDKADGLTVRACKYFK